MGDPDNSQEYNRYSYVNNNPINSTDPTGHYSVGDFFGLVADFSGISAVTNAFKNPSALNILTAVGALASLGKAKLIEEAIVNGVKAARTASGRDRLVGDRLDRLKSNAAYLAKHIDDFNPTALRAKNPGAYMERMYTRWHKQENKTGSDFVNWAQRAKANHGSYKCPGCKRSHSTRWYLGVAAQHFHKAGLNASLAASFAPKRSNTVRHMLSQASRANERCDTALRGYKGRGGRGNTTVHCFNGVPVLKLAD